MRDLNLIVLHHSASRVGTHSWDEIRSWHQARGFDGIGYHKGIVNIDGHWRIVSGRPLSWVGAHAKGFNLGSIGICVEGNYEEEIMPLEARGLCIQLCVDLCWDYNISAILGHRELPYATLCPGKNFPLEAIRNAVTGSIEQKKKES